MAKTNESTALATREVGQVVTEADALALLNNIVEGATVKVVEDPEAMQREITRRLLAAETEADILAGAPTFDPRPETAIRLLDFRLVNSDFEDGGGVGVFAAVTAADAQTGETVTFACGGVGILTRLLALKAKGFWPPKQMVRIYPQEEPTAAGFHPLVIEALGE